jgi:prevent-host-death family protein
MQTVNIHEAKTQFSRLVDAAAGGEEIIIAKAGKPAARLVPMERAKVARRFGGLKGKIRIAMLRFPMMCSQHSRVVDAPASRYTCVPLVGHG